MSDKSRSHRTGDTQTIAKGNGAAGAIANAPAAPSSDVTGLGLEPGRLFDAIGIPDGHWLADNAEPPEGATHDSPRLTVVHSDEIDFAEDDSEIIELLPADEALADAAPASQDEWPWLDPLTDDLDDRAIANG